MWICDNAVTNSEENRILEQKKALNIMIFLLPPGGDLIKYTAAILNINNWEACQYLVQAFSLPISLSGITDRRERFKRR